MVQDTSHFLDELQAEAKRQSVLSQSHFLPTSLDPLTALIGNYPWQVILLLSGVTALFLEVAGYWLG